MGRRKGIDAATLLAVFARSLERKGITDGAIVSRDFFDDAVMALCQVGPRSVENYIRQGTAFGYWTTLPKHGPGGRGDVKILGTRHPGAVQILS